MAPRWGASIETSFRRGQSSGRGEPSEAVGSAVLRDNGGMADELYCPTCREAVSDPLVCGDCHAVICRKCGTPLEKIDEMATG
jgi:hypothetical protein